MGAVMRPNGPGRDLTLSRFFLLQQRQGHLRHGVRLGQHGDTGLCVAACPSGVVKISNILKSSLTALVARRIIALTSAGVVCLPTNRSRISGRGFVLLVLFYVYGYIKRYSKNSRGIRLDVLSVGFLT